MSIKQIAAEIVFMTDEEIADLARYLVKQYPNTADRLEQDLRNSFLDRAVVTKEEVYSPYLGA